MLHRPVINASAWGGLAGLAGFALAGLACHAGQPVVAPGPGAVQSTAVSATTTRTTAIVGATVIDGTGAPPLRDATILLQGRRIRAVGPRPSLRLPVGTEVIDGRGRFVVPGFVDANVHIGGNSALANFGDATPDSAMARVAVDILRAGVTTIRDTWGRLAWLRQVRDRFRSGRPLGPRLLIAGNIVGWVADYSVKDVLRPRTSGEMAAIDSATHGSGPDLIGLDPDSLRRRIRRYLDTGVDQIKYGGTTHAALPDILFSARAQRVIVEEAHRRGLPVETHATTPEAMRAAVLAGVDMVTHAEILATATPAGDFDFLPIPDDLARLIGRRGMLCSLIPLWEHSVRDSLILTANRRKLFHAGCAVVPSTDAGTPGELTVRAIEALVTSVGLTPMEALVAATRNGARACRMLDQFGTIEPGKLADLVVLAADPLQDIKHIEQVMLVFTEGRRVESRAPATPSHQP